MYYHVIHHDYSSNHTACAKHEQKISYRQGITYKHQIAQYVEKEHEKVKGEVQEYTELFRGHATKEDFDKKTLIEQIVKEEILMNYFTPPN